MENKDLIKKADIALSDLASNGGLLNPEQSDTFMRTLIDSPTILGASRVVSMKAPQMKINKIGFGSRILRAAVENTALSSTDRVKPTQSQVLLNTDEVIAEIHIPYSVMEDNIERASINGAMGTPGGGIHNTIVQLIAERAALDLEELALLGDSASTDSYLALTDGYLKLATAHIVDAGNTTISKTLLKNGVKAMPDKYLRDRAAMWHTFSVDNETEYRDTYSNRQTLLGDNMVQGIAPVYAWGSQLMSAALMPNTKGLFTNPKNLIFGIQRDVTIEYDKDIRARTFIIVLTARVAFQIEEIDAVVKYIGING